MPVAGFKDLDLKDLSLGRCEGLDMNKEMEVIINMKNLEKLDITGTNISVLSEGDSTDGSFGEHLLSECLGQ